jgi:hypothetical protein
MKNLPAFPQQFDGTSEPSLSGLSMRDYFAAKAMQGMMVDTEIPNCTHIAKESYRMADAMLEAREA